MYTVRSDDEGRWILYEVGGGNFNVVAWFADQADAEFARQAFERRELRAEASEANRPGEGSRR